MSPSLFIGRFQPFHLGHLDAIQQILATHKKIIIGIGSAQYEGIETNPYSAALRRRMIEESLHDVDIVKEAGGIHRALLKEMRGIQADQNLVIEFIPRAGFPPILNAFELVEEPGR